VLRTDVLHQLQHVYEVSYLPSHHTANLKTKSPPAQLRSDQIKTARKTPDKTLIVAYCMYTSVRGRTTDTGIPSSHHPSHHASYPPSPSPTIHTVLTHHTQPISHRPPVPSASQPASPRPIARTRITARLATRDLLAALLVTPVLLATPALSAPSARACTNYDEGAYPCPSCVPVPCLIRR